MHSTLSLLFQLDEDITAKHVVMQRRQKFNTKLKKASCHFQQTEPFTLRLNTAEKEVNKLKKGSETKMKKSKAPKRLCDDC